MTKEFKSYLNLLRAIKCGTVGSFLEDNKYDFSVSVLCKVIEAYETLLQDNQDVDGMEWVAKEVDNYRLHITEKFSKSLSLEADKLVREVFKANGMISEDVLTDMNRLVEDATTYNRILDLDNYGEQIHVYLTDDGICIDDDMHYYKPQE